MQNAPKVSALILKSFINSKANNPRYSLRAFSRKLGMSPGAVSQIIKGKRAISLKLGEKISDRLAFDPQTKAEFIRAIVYAKNKESLLNRPEPATYSEIELDQFSLIAEWYHYGILSLLNTAGFKNDITWISSRLGITEKQAREAIERLKRLDMISESPKGKLSRKKSSFRTSDNVANMALRRFHFQDLDLIRASLERDPIQMRDYSSITMAVSLKHFDKARTMIRKFQDDLCELMQTDPTSEVFRLSVALYPLTRLQRPGGESK